MVTIEVLTFPGCPNSRPAIDAAIAIARELDPTIDVREVTVGADEVERLRFLGSPTVRVNGRDVEPGADERTTYGFTCRTYVTPDGRSGRPSDELIRAGIARAASV